MWSTTVRFEGSVEMSDSSVYRYMVKLHVYKQRTQKFRESSQDTHLLRWIV